LYWIESIVEQMGYSFAKSRRALWSISIRKVLRSIDGELLLVCPVIDSSGSQTYVLFDMILKLVMHQIILRDAQHHPEIVLSTLIEIANCHFTLTFHLYSPDSMD
jgi:hypothetical protein